MKATIFINFLSTEKILLSQYVTEVCSNSASACMGSVASEYTHGFEVTKRQ